MQKAILVDEPVPSPDYENGIPPRLTDDAPEYKPRT